jgi:16S rRNA (cytosine967-C5)-methyltransferase
MRLGGRLQAAIEVLGDIEAGKRPASDVLKDWGSAHRFAGAGDRAVIGNIVYDALRRKLSIAWRMDADDARALAFGALLADGGMDIAAIDAALDGDKFAPETLEQARRIAWASRDSAAAPDYVQADVPEWCAASLQELFGERWVEEGKALATRPPVDLRVNSLKAKPEQTLTALEKAGAAPAPFLACRANRPFSTAGSKCRIWARSWRRFLLEPSPASRFSIIAPVRAARRWR